MKDLRRTRHYILATTNINKPEHFVITSQLDDPILRTRVRGSLLSFETFLSLRPFPSTPISAFQQPFNGDEEVVIQKPRD